MINEQNGIFLALGSLAYFVAKRLKVRRNKKKINTSF